MTYYAAVIQMHGGPDATANWNQCEPLIREAAARGAALIVTPENANFVGPSARKIAEAETLEGPTCGRFSSLAAELKITLVLGSFNEKAPSPGKCCNTSVIFGPDGAIVATYRKLHLFDVVLNDQQRYCESDSVTPGDRVVAAQTPLGCLGMSVCYDLRFGELYRALREKGAEVLLIPAAFTLTTGKDHWECLVRARAIENQCYVIAPGQWGRHQGDDLKESYGHSMIVDPWGHVIARVSDGVGYATALIDLSRVSRTRAAIPIDQHRRRDIAELGR